MQKPVLLEFNFHTSSKPSNPPVKARLELSAKKQKTFKLQDVMGKVEKANENRKKLIKGKLEKLHKTHKQVFNTHKKAIEMKGKKLQALKEKTKKKQESVMSRRKKLLNNRVKKLGEHNLRVAKIAKEQKKKRQELPKEVAAKMAQQMAKEISNGPEATQSAREAVSKQKHKLQEHSETEKK